MPFLPLIPLRLQGDWCVNWSTGFRRSGETGHTQQRWPSPVHPESRYLVGTPSNEHISATRPGSGKVT